MTTRIRWIALVGLALFSVVPSKAQLFQSTTKVGTTAAQFLKIGPGARSLAMGGSAVALEGDAYAAYWNPGALARVPSLGEASFTHAAWLADISYDYAVASLNVDGVGTVGLQLTSLSVPQDIVRTVANPDGDGRQWSAGSFAMGVSLGRSLTDRFSIGMTFKYIHESIWNESSQGVAFDVGTIYTTQFHDMKIGASISNFGTRLQLAGQDLRFNSNPGGLLGQGPQNVASEYQADAYDLPLTFRLGLSMDALKSDNFRTTFVLDATHPNDNAEYMNGGLEAAYQETFFARVGYKSLFLPNTEQGLTWGVGVKVGVSNATAFSVDYAFADYGRLSNVQYVTISAMY